MLCFPQLMTGAVGQFPGSKRLLRRTVVNEAADGSVVKLGDSTAEVEWALELKGLADSEWEAIEDLFGKVEGRLGTFTFLDPFGNLLSWSEDLASAVWVKTAGLSIVSGRDDPLGGADACEITNSGATEGMLLQRLAAPGWYRYCLSVYARSAAGRTLRLFARTPGVEAAKEVVLGPAWQRFTHSVNLASSEGTVEFGAAIAPGATVDLFGFQAEPQAGASRYRKTTGRGGVYEASFADDEILRTANGLDDSACSVRIRARR